ncbi:MAG: glycosyltransferase family 4 protein [Thermodesulfobacteriota bacterium]
MGDGAEGIHIAEMVNAFRQLGHEVLLVGPGVGQPTAPGVKTSRKFSWVKSFFKGPFYEMVEVFYNIFGYFTLLKAIRSFRPHFIYDRYIIFNYSAVAAARKCNLPIFLEVNAPLSYEREHEPDEKLYLKKLAYFIEKKACINASKTIVVSTPLFQYLNKIGVPGRKIAILPNGVNQQKFYPRNKSRELMSALRYSETDIIIGFVGILRPWHGVDMLIDAFAEIVEAFPQCKLLLVGDGPIQTEIESHVESLGLGKKVFVTGRVPHADVGEYVALFDVAVSPKATFYASPMKIVEYMAQAKAVLAPDMANIRDIIDHDVTGLLFEPDNRESLAMTLRELVSDNNKRDQLGKMAHGATQSRLNWQVNAERVIGFCGAPDEQ